MKTYQDRALKLCADYAKLRDDVESMSRKIGAHGQACFDARIAVDGYDDGEPHLTEFFKARKEAMYHDPDYGCSGNPDDGMSEDELKEKCSHCYAALQVINERKTARRQLAHIKRQIVMLGRTAQKSAIKLPVLLRFKTIRNL